MEIAVARAFKSSLRRELAFMKSTQQVICNDDYWCLNPNNGVSGEDFSVDDLFDFSNGECQPGPVGVGNGDDYEEEDEEKDSFSVSSQDRSEDDSSSGSVSGTADSESFFARELAVPMDDLLELEWVSHFVDDSLPESLLLYPVHSEQTSKRAEPEAKPDTTKTPCFPSKVPVKERSRKSRKAKASPWSFIPLLSGSGSGHSSPSSCSSRLSSTPALIFAGTVPNLELLHGHGEPAAKKQKKKSEAQFQQRCSHCQVQKTPQWRTGPLGAKTLCNACGVRYKSGRLFPEYRPACSPTFSGEIHSNSHRKVLEMRRKKETAGPQAGLTQTPLVPSC